MTQSVCLVTDGAGFLGVNLCRFLPSHDQVVRSLDIARFDNPERGAVQAVLGDIRDRDAVDRVMAGVRVVVHCAAALPLQSEQEIFTPNVEGEHPPGERDAAQARSRSETMRASRSSSISTER